MSGGPTWGLGRKVDKPLLESQNHRLGAIVGIQFAQQAADVGFHGVDGDNKAIGNLLVAHALAQSTKDIFLFHGQVCRHGAGRFATESTVMEHIGDDRIVVRAIGLDRGESCCHCAHPHILVGA